MAPDLVLLGEIVQIPANGLGADVKMGHQIVGRDKAPPVRTSRISRCRWVCFTLCTPQMRRKRPRHCGPLAVYPIPFGIDKGRITFYALSAAALWAIEMFSL